MPRRTIQLPDGRTLTASYEGEDVGWVAHLHDAPDRPVGGRVLTDVLYDLLDLVPSQEPGWFREVLYALWSFRARETPDGLRFPCPCCGCFTLIEPPSDTYALCPVCWWEDDGVQFRDPRRPRGANAASLEEARANFRRIGASDPRLLDFVRPPQPAERAD